MKIYVVEYRNVLTFERYYMHTEAESAQKALNIFFERDGNNDKHEVLNVFVEAEKVWG